MSTAQILTELPYLSHSDRREIGRRLIELEDEAQTLAECDASGADANFQWLDAVEAQDKAPEVYKSERDSIRYGHGSPNS